MNVQSVEKNPYIQNPLIAPIIHFHSRAISTFDDLPENGKVVEIAMRIAILVVSPLAYLALGILALVGLACHSLFKTSDSEGSASTSQSVTQQHSPARVVSTIPAVFQSMTSQWMLKEVVKLLSVSRESPFVREYLNCITPKQAAEKEGIDLNVLVESFKEKDLYKGYLSFEGEGLISALDTAIKNAKMDPSQGLKQMWAAILAMKILQESLMDWMVVFPMVEVLYRYACTGKVEGDLIIESQHASKSTIKLTDIVEDAVEPYSLESAIKELEKDEKLPALRKTLKETINFAPHLLEGNKSFQQMQDEDLKKWNDEFKNILKEEPNSVKQKLRTHRVPLYQKTKDACERGFFVQNKLIKLNGVLKGEMIQNTQLYSPDPLTPLTSESLPTVPTVFEVVDQDTIDLTKQYQDTNLKPVALNLANANIPGGGVENGDGAQEESLFRRSNYYQALCPRQGGSENALYPIAENQVIYTPDVQIFRTGELDYTQPIKETDVAYEFHIPYAVSFIAAAHVELNRASQVNELKNLDEEFAKNQSKESKAKLEQICDEILKEMGIEGTYEQVSKQKMRAILRTACLPDDTGKQKHDSVVLGALGCGAFGNPRCLNAHYWKEVFKELEFQGRFKKVGFAIRSFGSQHLINTFKKTIDTLNQSL